VHRRPPAPASQTGTSADVANLMEYLLADGSSMMNGSVVVMDGGQAARG
jgi:NAD(P)-dependent dehydrogenase (short-subunit alcohol dehydrogenase family)